MARQPICLVPVHWTPREVHRHSCSDGSHTHISHAERRRLIAAGVADYVVYPRVLRMKHTVPLRGLSARTGAYLAVQIYEGCAWARTMLSAILRSSA
ncbi:MAG TPA: hypothetical protein VMS37_13800 [Verrucomicrobiae bacterium]|nr:hypothetical protein [Patescibacteria group bacterium]HXK03473.1 hypothetical protein [Verrucomicrobiae bacterium]